MDQYILIRGRDEANPVLLFLHGGPGAVETPLFDKYYRGLEKHFTVALWEQRGAGKSASPALDPKTLNISQMVSDTGEVVDYLKRRLDKTKILLVGDSWGGFLGILAAQRYSGSLSAYVAFSPALAVGESFALSHEEMEKRAAENGDRGASRKLARSRPPFDFREDGEFGRFGLHQMMVAGSGGYLDGKKTMLPLLSVYSIPGIIGMQKSQKTLWRAMGNELCSTNLADSVKKLDVPFFLALGRRDGNIPPATTVRFFDALSAPRKELAWFEHSAHMILKDEPAQVEKFLVETVRASIVAGASDGRP